MTLKKELIKNRLDRLEESGEDIEESKKQDTKKSEHRGITISQKVADEPPRFRQVRELIAGGSSNYYISKEGEIIQRVLIHLPLIQVENLKRQAFESVPRMTLSGLIRKKLK